jgi:hypothetical protein
MPTVTGEVHRPQARFSPVNFTEYPRFLMPANNSSTAKLLSNFPCVENADCWRGALAMLKAIPEVRTSHDTALLAAFFYVAANLPASFLEQSSDVFLREASTVAIVLSNFSTGSFDVEFQAQRRDLAAFTSQ